MGLIGWWKLDGNAQDSAGNNHGTIHGATSTDGKIGQAVNFEGHSTGQHINFGNSSKFDIRGRMSISLWVKFHSHTQDSRYDLIVGRSVSSGWDDSNFNIMRYHNHNNRMRIYIQDDSGTTTSITNFYPTLNQWIHLTAIYNGTHLLLYVNGDLFSSQSTSINMLRDVSGADLTIGANKNQSDRAFRGDINDVRIYNHALSTKEVKELSRAKTGHWKMNTSENNTLIDSSGYGRDGTIQGTDFTDDVKIGSSSLYFDEGDRVDADINTGDTNEISVSAWIKPEASSDSRAPIVRIDRWYFQVYDNNRLATYWYGRSSAGYHYSTSNSIPMNVWSHVCVVWSDSDVKFYINGTLDNTISSVTGKGDRNEWVRLGYESSSRRYKGIIDDVRIYATALNDDDVKELYLQRASLDNKGNYFVHELSSHNNVTVFTNPSGGSHNGSYGLRFSVSKPLVIQSAIVRPYFTGYMTAQLYNFDTSQLIQETDDISVVSGVNQRVKLNLLCKPGINYWLSPTGGDFMRTDSGVSFPIQDQEFTFTTGSNIGGSTASRWYYFFGIFYSPINILEKTGVYKIANISEVGPTNGLVGWWPLNGDTKDISGEGNDGTNNGASIVPGLNGLAYEFNGSSNYIGVGNVDYDYDNFTVSIWAKASTNNNSDPDFPIHVTNLIGKGNWNSSNNWYIGFRGSGSNPANNLSFVYGISWSSGPSYSVNNFDLSEWNHYVGVATPSKQKLYLNGNLVSEITTTKSNVSNSYNLEIARSSYSSRFFSGKIFDTRIYSRALSAEEVKILYDVTRPDGPRMKKTKEGVYVRGEFDETL